MNRPGRVVRNSGLLGESPVATTWFVALAAFPSLDILPGDLVRYEPGQEWPIEIVRSIPVSNTSLLWQATSSGALQRVCDIDASEQ